MDHHQCLEPLVRFVPCFHRKPGKECRKRHDAVTQQVIVCNQSETAEIEQFCRLFVQLFVFYGGQLGKVDEHDQHAVHGCKNHTDIRSDFAVAFAFVVKPCRHHDKPDRQNQADKETAHRKIDDLKCSKQKHCHRYDRCACFGNHPVQIHLFFLLHIPKYLSKREPSNRKGA